MNWPIWLPITRTIWSSEGSGLRISRLKNSSTARVTLPARTGKANAPWSPALAASCARWKPSSRLTSGIELDVPLIHTCPTRARWVGWNVISRTSAMKSVNGFSGMLQVSTQATAFFRSSMLQRAPQSQLSVSQMVWTIFGMASASVSDSASTRVTACSILSRCSARLRSEMSRETTTTFDRLAENRLDALAILGVDLLEGIGVRLDLAVLEDGPVGGAVVDAPAFGVDHRDQVANVLGDEAEALFALAQLLFRVPVLG